MVGRGPAPRPLSTLSMMLAAGMFIFVSFLLVLHLSLIYAGVKLDSSIMNFYPMMAGAGILFGFERW